MNSGIRELIFLLILSENLTRKTNFPENVLPLSLCLHIIKAHDRILLIFCIIMDRSNGSDKYLTHSLHYPSTDPVLQRINDQ